MKALVLFGILFNTSILAFASPTDCNGILQSLANAKKMMAERGSEKDKLLAEVPHFIRIRTGIPSTLQLVSVAGKVFRHYTSKEGLQNIIGTKTLKAGWTPFYYSGYMTDYNEDLTGVFLTTPSTKPHTVGVRSESADYVDLKLHKDTGLLFLREGILLIPGAPQIESWKIRIFQGKDRSLYNAYAEEFERWDKNGIPQPLEIPIEIVDHSK